MTPRSAIEQARRGQLLPVYLVAGEERLLRDDVIAAVRAASLGTGVAAFNEDKFTAGEVDADRVVSAARTVPMMAPRRFVLVRSVERWDSGGEDGERASSALDRLTEYAKAPVDTTCLVLVATKLDGRRKLAVLAKKQGFLVECAALSAHELPGWIAEASKDKGHAIDRETAALLAELAGPELSYVADAIERLSLFVGPGKPIDGEAVAQCVARVRTADTWAVVGAVSRQRLGDALAALSEAYDPRDRGLMMLGALAWSVRRLARYKAATDAGVPHDEAARRAGAFGPQQGRELAERARGLRGKELERWVLVLAETDLALKGSRRPPEAILADMITRLCRR